MSREKPLRRPEAIIAYPARYLPDRDRLILGSQYEMPGNAALAKSFVFNRCLGGVFRTRDYAWERVDELVSCKRWLQAAVSAGYHVCAWDELDRESRSRISPPVSLPGFIFRVPERCTG